MNPVYFSNIVAGLQNQAAIDALTRLVYCAPGSNYQGQMDTYEMVEWLLEEWAYESLHGYAKVVTRGY